MSSGSFAILTILSFLSSFQQVRKLRSGEFAFMSHTLNAIRLHHSTRLSPKSILLPPPPLTSVIVCCYVSFPIFWNIWSRFYFVPEFDGLLQTTAAPFKLALSNGFCRSIKMITFSRPWPIPTSWLRPVPSGKKKRKKMAGGWHVIRMSVFCSLVVYFI